MTDRHDARPSLRCQPIASLATRRRAYWREVRAALWLLGFLLGGAGALSWAAVQLFGASWFGAAVACAVIMAPPVWFFWPDFPTQDQVERDRALRRAAGLPDKVEHD